MRRERTGAPDDAEDGASGAVVGGAGAAPFARATADVDLSDDALADPVPIPVGRRVHHADEFVPWYAREPGVSFQDLEVGAADAGQPHRNPALAGSGLDVVRLDTHGVTRFVPVGAGVGRGVDVDDERFHERDRIRCHA
jgi:hypothetical protein